MFNGNLLPTDAHGKTEKSYVYGCLLGGKIFLFPPSKLLRAREGAIVSPSYNERGMIFDLLFRWM